MSTTRTCNTPKEGWGLCHHFLANLLLSISMEKDIMDEEPDEVKRDRHERSIFDTWAQLVGNLFMVMYRMKVNGHVGEAARMQQIIDMVVQSDITDPAIRELIHEKAKELDPRLNQFEAELAKLKPEHK